MTAIGELESIMTFQIENTIIDQKSYLVDTRESHFVENWDQEFACNDE